jgi:hypothetical protein
MHVKPNNNQAFIYTNIAISIADDLGLGQQHPNMNVFSAFNTKGLIGRSLFTQAARKAYLGCYYLSSALSMGFQKPNNLHYKNLMDHRGEIVLQEESSGIFSASDIYALVRLQNLTERIGEAHSKPPETSERSDDPLWDEMNIQKFLGELDEWRRLAPNSIRNLRTSPPPITIILINGPSLRCNRRAFCRNYNLQPHPQPASTSLLRPPKTKLQLHFQPHSEHSTPLFMSHRFQNLL